RAFGNLGQEPWPAEMGLYVAFGDGDRGRELTGVDLRRDLAQELADLALQAAHAGLPRVALDDGQQRLVTNGDFSGVEPVALHLALDQVVPRDGQLLLDRV